MVGETISHYTIIEKLGEGGMGLVYKARDIKLDRFVALKFLSPALEANSEISQRFINEAKTASALDHANIGAIYEIDETKDGQMFIAMAYYEGDTLKHKIAGGELPVATVLDYAIQIVRGLAKAHEHGIIHRDLKPANILITKDGVAKVIDFGLAKLQGGGQLTRSGTSVGTIAYMSPEQARGEDTDKRTDIASLGSVMYEMLTGRPPYQAEFEAAILYLIVNEEPKPLSTLRGDIPAGLAHIVEKMMHKKPEERYQELTQVLQDLTGLAEEAKSGTRHRLTRQSRVVTIPAVRFTFKVGPLMVVGSLVIVLALGLILFRVFTGKRELTSADRSVVVLPITNLGDPEHQYLADGITKHMIQRLSVIPELITVSTPTSFLYSKTPLTDDSLAARLGIRFIVKGFLRLLGTKAFFEIFMYDRIEHEQVWRAELEGERSELLKLEMQSVKMILGGLGIEQAGIDLRSDYPAPEVYEGYLRAMYHMNEEQESNLALAKELLRDILKKDSSYAPGWTLLAAAYVIAYENHWKATDDDLVQAERAARQALRCDSSFMRAYIELSNVQFQRGDQAGAVKLLQNVLEKRPNDVPTMQSLAKIHLIQLGDPARGLFYLKKILAYDPTDWQVLMYTGIAYAQLKDYPQAMIFFTRTVGINPDNADIWTNLGYTLERTGRYDSAVTCYTEAVTKVPVDNQPFLNLSDLFIASGKYTAAESLLTQRLTAAPNEDELIYRIGFVYAKLGKPALSRAKFIEGSTLLEDRMRKNKTSAMYRASYGLFQARLNDVKKAVEFGEQAIRIDSSEEVTLALAKIYAAVGMKDRMIAAFRAAKEKNVEYDAEYLHSAFDFDRYKSDPDLLAIARQR